MTTVVCNASGTAAATLALRLFLIASGSEKACLGYCRGTVVLMLEAAARPPDYPQIIFNAVVTEEICD